VKRKKVVALMIVCTMLLSACSQQPATDVSQNTDVSQKTEAEPEKSEDKAETQPQEDDAAESKYPEYLNMDATYPIIKDEYKDEMSHKVKVAYQAAGGVTRSFEELWIDTYYNEKYNLDFDVQLINSQAFEEQKNLILNSGDMPDMIWNFYLSPSEIYKYGAVEGIFLPLDEYITEELCPNLYKHLIANDYVRETLTAPDGHIYSLPYLDEEDNPTSFTLRPWINEKYLNAIGEELPTTVDEFVDLMYALKEKDPSGLGSQNFYPMGITMHKSLSSALLNGFGYLIGNTPFGNKVSVRDGEAVIPAYDMEVFQEYLKIMNQFYQDEIIHPNCFVLDESAAVTMLLDGATAGWEIPVEVYNAQDWADWGAMIPLTSDWQESPEALKPSTVNVGSFLVSADTEYPELVLRFADQYYNNETGCTWDFWGGVPANSEWATEGYVFNTLSEDGTGVVPESEYTDGVDIWSYYTQYLHGNMPYFGNYGTYEAGVKKLLDAGVDSSKMKGQFDYDLTISTEFSTNSLYERVRPYSTAGFPSLYFVDDKTSQRIVDLETVIYPYIEEQVALFITGGRSLTETDAFVAELEGMGIKELLEIYRSIY